MEWEGLKRLEDRMILRIGLVLAAVCLAAGVFCRYRYRLEDPVFLENEKVAFIHQDDEDGWYANLSIRYFCDIRDARTLITMEFPELEELGIDAVFESGSGEFQESGNQNGFYVLRTLRGRIRGMGDWKNLVTLTRGNARLSDGTLMMVDLGTILLIEDLKEETLAEIISSTGSSSGSGQVVFEMKEDAYVEAKNLYLPPAKGDFTVSINGREFSEYPGQKYKGGEQNTLEYRWKPPEESKERLVDRKAAASVLVSSGGRRQVLLIPVQLFQSKDEISCYHIWKYLRGRGEF